MADKRKLTRRSILASLAGAGTAALGSALTSNGAEGNLYGGNMALSEAYNVAGKLWIGPDSARSSVEPDAGRVYMASDDQVEYHGDGSSWVKMGVGSSQNPVPSVHTDYADITDRWDFEPGYRVSLTQLTDSGEDHNEPQIRRGPGGTVAIAFRRGSDHESNDGRLLVAELQDYDTDSPSLGPETVIADDASYDTRNHAFAYLPAADRWVCFYRINDASTGTQQDIRVTTSDGDLTSWANDTSIQSALSITDPIAFGKPILTVNGWMQAFYTPNSKYEVLYSADGGQSWGSSELVVDKSGATDKYTEPVPVPLDGDGRTDAASQVIVIGRSSNNDWYYIPGDIGESWYSTLEADWSPSLGPNASPTPMMVQTVGDNEVLFMYGQRGNGNDKTLWTKTISKAALENSVQALTTARFAPLARFPGSIDNTDFGYPTAVSLGPRPEDALVAFYSDARGAVDGSPELFVVSATS